MSVQLNFDYKKATQALNYFARQEGSKISKLKALKLVYLADRYHLRKYGRPITNDDYWAMKLGPVPSGTRDIAGLNAEYLDEREITYARESIEIHGHALRSKRPVDDMVFSDSDLEALDFAWSRFGHLPEFDLADLTHQYPEWKKHQQALELNPRIHMHIEDFLNDPAEGVDKCYELSDDERRSTLEHLKEISELAALWS